MMAMPIPLVSHESGPSSASSSSSWPRDSTASTSHASANAQDQKKKKKSGAHPWRRKKPAAGLMANPGMATLPVPPPALGSTRSESAISTRPSPGEERGGYYSGLEESSDDDENGSDWERRSDVDVDADLRPEDIPVTGFAVASHRRNADFHKLFPTVPAEDYLIEDYRCALQREILVQGQLYVSENHICFHANIFGWVTDLCIAIDEITTLEKRMTAFVIPTAIRVKTARAEYTFASMLTRDTAYDVIYNIWRLVRPADARAVDSGSLGVTGATVTEGTIIGGAEGARRPTQCACGKDGSHFAHTALDTVIPGTPDKIYTLMFASQFMKDFMVVEQKLLDIQISDWAPASEGSPLLARTMSFTKPLTGTGGFGPSQAKCEIREEAAHADFDDYVSMVTTTRTPNVPSGGAFAVKTRACIMWASPLASRLVVTTQVDWTGGSFLKGIINSSAVSGQKVYHAELERAMRAYIKEHQAEFIPEGVDPAAIDVPEPTLDAGVDAAGTADSESHAQGGGWKAVLALVRGAWENATATSILCALIGVLIASNVWTYARMGSRSTVDGAGWRAKELARNGQQCAASCGGLPAGHLLVNGACRQSGCCCCC